MRAEGCRFSKYIAICTRNIHCFEFVVLSDINSDEYAKKCKRMINYLWAVAIISFRDFGVCQSAALKLSAINLFYKIYSGVPSTLVSQLLFVFILAVTKIPGDDGRQGVQCVFEELFKKVETL